MSLQVNLHQHTEGSFLDGLARVEEVVARAVDLGQPYIAFTDHGECNQHLTGAKAAEAAGIGFIPGLEGYWLLPEQVAWHREQKDRKLRYPSPSHICLLAANQKGLRNLWALSSIAYTEKYFDYKPTATPELLKEYSEGIYASDGCMITRFANAVEDGREDEARQLLGILLDIYGDRFYMELHTWQFMELPELPKVVEVPDVAPGDLPLFLEPQEVTQQLTQDLANYHRIKNMHDLNARMTRLNQAKVRFATELGVPLVVVNDSHHATPEQWEAKELVWAFNTSNNDGDKLSTKLSEMAQKADHLMGEDELYFWMDRHGIGKEVVSEAIKNSYDIASKCKVQIIPTLGIPSMAPTESQDLIDLIAACEAGFRRYVTDEGLPEQPYFERLEEELGLISQKHFSGYFNMVRDYVMAYRSGAWSQYVRKGAPKQPLLVGPGRGSVGGSLVAYLLGIDLIDPIKYGTLFSRFLSPSRKGLPDIDVDVPQSQRPDALSYLSARFGSENVCAIGTLSRNGPKSTLKDLGRALKVPYVDLEAMSAHIEEVERLKDPDDPDEQELTWGELVERKGHDLVPWARKYPQLFAKMGELTGLARHSGVHPAGVLVSSVPVLGAVPMRRTKNKVITTQFDMNEVEALGGVKLDLLGLRHLDTLSYARQLIYERHGVWIDYDRTGLSVPAGCTNVLTFGEEHFRDPAIWEQIDLGQTLGVFQMETSTGTETAIELHPRSEVDVADLSAVVRPGVADAGLKDVYLRRRSGQEPVVYDHPLMEQIVGPGWSTDTFGILVYQEQLMRAVEILANFTADESDDLRKFVGKKNMEKLQALKGKFIQGCLDNSEFLSPIGGEKAATKTAYKIWDSIEAAGRYGFNWSHAVGYAFVSTWEIWTKHHYPQEFLVALMATDSGNVNRYVREARRRNITILPPDVNTSERKFSIEGEAIRYGLDTVRGVGKAGCTDILSHRPYSSLSNFLARAERGANKTTVYNLILIGAFDSMGSREDMLRELQRLRATEDLAQSTLDNPEKLAATIDRRLASDAAKYSIDIPDFTDPKVVYEIEKELVGTYVTVDPMERYVKALDNVALRDPVDMMRYDKGQGFVVGGQLTAISPTTTKKGKNPGQEMAHLTIAWNEADFRVVAFPDSWARTKLLLDLGAPVACKVVKLDSGCCLQSVDRLDLLLDRAGIA